MISKGPRSLFAIAPKWLTFDGRGLDCFGRIQNVDVAETFAVEPPNGAPHFLHVLADHVIRKITIGSQSVTLCAYSLRNVEHDGHRDTVILASERDQRLARLGLDVGRINYCHASRLQPLGGDEVQDFEGIDGCRLIVLVVAHQPATEIRRNDFGRQEDPPREGRFAGPDGPINTTRESSGTVMFTD